MTKEKICFLSKIKLTPAIGDWTTLKPINRDLEELNIAKLQEINFDTLAKKYFHYSLFLHYRLAEIITKKLSNDLNIKIELHTVEARQLPYKDFIENQKDYLFQGNIFLNKLGKMNVLIESKFADMIINRMTGGKGELSFNKPLSELELEILNLQIKEIMPGFLDIWKNILHVDDLEYEAFNGRFNMDQKVSLRETYLYYTFWFYFGEKNLVKIIWGYPNYLLKTLLNLKSKLSDQIKKRVLIDYKTMEKIKVPVKAVLGKTNITMGELKNLQEGDILTLDNKFHDPVELYLGKSKYLCQPGVVNNKLAIQVINYDFSEQVIKEYRKKNIGMKYSKKVGEEIEESLSDEPNLLSEESFQNDEQQVSIENENSSEQDIEEEIDTAENFTEDKEHEEHEEEFEHDEEAVDEEPEEEEVEEEPEEELDESSDHEENEEHAEESEPEEEAVEEEPEEEEAEEEPEEELDESSDHEENEEPEEEEVEEEPVEEAVAEEPEEEEVAEEPVEEPEQENEDQSNNLTTTLPEVSVGTNDISEKESPGEEEDDDDFSWDDIDTAKS